MLRWPRRRPTGWPARSPRPPAAKSRLDREQTAQLPDERVRVVEPVGERPVGVPGRDPLHHPPSHEPPQRGVDRGTAEVRPPGDLGWPAELVFRPEEAE